MKGKISIIICSIFLVLISSCSNPIKEDKKNLEETLVGEKVFVNFTIGDSSARTMMPEFNNDKFVHIKLFGEMAGVNGEYSNNPKILGEWATDSNATSYEKLIADKIELKEGTWKFTLYAYPEGEGFTFSGSTIKNISVKENNTVSFKLRVKGIRPTTGEGGHFETKFYIPDEVKYVTAGLTYGTENEMSKFGSDYIIGTPDGDGIYKDENWYYGEIELEIKTDTNGKQYVEYSDSDYSQKNNGRTGLPNGSYVIWVRMFLSEDDSINNYGKDCDTWGGEYKEFLWIADGETTTAERTLQLKYDGCLGLLDIKGVLPGFTVSLTYENGTSTDSLIPEQFKRTKGYKFTGFLDEDGNKVTTLDETTNGKKLHAYYYITMNIPKFIGQNGESDVIGKTWDNIFITDSLGNATKQPYSILIGKDNAMVVTHHLKNNDSDKLSGDFTFDETCMVTPTMNGEKVADEKYYYYEDKIFKDTILLYSNLTQKADNSTAHIAENDYLYSEGYVGTTTDYNLKHTSAVLKFKLTGLPTDKVFKKMVLYVPGERIRSEMRDIGYDNTADDYEIIWEPESEVERYNHYFLNLGESGNGLNASADGTLTLYSLLPPKDYSGKTIICTLVDDSNYNYVCYFEEGLNIEEGKLYPMNGAPQKIAKEYIFKISAGGNGWRNTLVSVCNKGGYSPEDLGDFIGSDDSDLPFVSEGTLKEHWQAFLETPDITWEWGTSHGVKGCFARGIEYGSMEDISVFIPANGWIIKDYNNGAALRDYYGFGNSLNYWIGALVENTDYVYCMLGDKDDPGVMGYIYKGTEINAQTLYSYREVTYDN